MNSRELAPPVAGSVFILIVLVGLVVLAIGWVFLGTSLRHRNACSLTPVVQSYRER